jgi:MerR family transcriptional regulator, light-induced transcriptional regulator
MVASEMLLKTRQVAEALGVSVSTIKRWVDSGALRATRTVGRHRLIRLSEALRFARSQGLPHANLELLVGAGTTHLGAIDDRVRVTLTTALREGRTREAKALIHSVYASEQSAVALADQLIRPVMERIGHGWMVGALDVFHEHQASLIVATALMDLIDRTASSTVKAPPLVLGAAPEGDPYLLAGLLAELILREEGWEVRNLGVNLPLRSLANAVLEFRPRMVYLSASYLPDEDRFVREYTSFYETAAAHDVAVILGGQALRPEVRSRLVFASFGDRMTHLSEFARRLHPVSGASANNDSE